LSFGNAFKEVQGVVQSAMKNIDLSASKSARKWIGKSNIRTTEAINRRLNWRNVKESKGIFPRHKWTSSQA